MDDTNSNPKKKMAAMIALNMRNPFLKGGEPTPPVAKPATPAESNRSGRCKQAILAHSRFCCGPVKAA
jgi:hypothetical protein